MSDGVLLSLAGEVVAAVDGCVFENATLGGGSAAFVWRGALSWSGCSFSGPRSSSSGLVRGRGRAVAEGATPSPAASPVCNVMLTGVQTAEFVSSTAGVLCVRGAVFRDLTASAIRFTGQRLVIAESSFLRVTSTVQGTGFYASCSGGRVEVRRVCMDTVRSSTDGSFSYVVQGDSDVGQSTFVRSETAAGAICGGDALRWYGAGVDEFYLVNVSHARTAANTANMCADFDSSTRLAVHIDFAQFQLCSTAGWLWINRHAGSTHHVQHSVFIGNNATWAGFRHNGVGAVGFPVTQCMFVGNVGTVFQAANGSARLVLSDCWFDVAAEGTGFTVAGQTLLGYSAALPTAITQFLCESPSPTRTRSPAPTPTGTRSPAPTPTASGTAPPSTHLASVSRTAWNRGRVSVYRAQRALFRGFFGVMLIVPEM